MKIKIINKKDQHYGRVFEVVEINPNYEMPFIVVPPEDEYLMHTSDPLDKECARYCFEGNEFEFVSH